MMRYRILDGGDIFFYAFQVLVLVYKSFVPCEEIRDLKDVTG